jgi:hypothetical protein
MTFYTAIYTGGESKYFEQGERYDIVLAELSRQFEMRKHSNLNHKTTHNSVENLLNTWSFIAPVKINNTQL